MDASAPAEAKRAAGNGPDAAVEFGSDGGDDAVPHPEPLCDGSEEIRLWFESGGGFVTPEYAFTNPYGSDFFTVDGQCRFYVGADHIRGLRTGVLDDASRAELQTLFAALPEMAELQRSTPAVASPCSDGGGAGISRAGAGVACGCGPTRCPDAVGEYVEQAYTWRSRLWKLGTGLQGPVRVASAPSGPNAPWKAFEWPLSWDLTELDREDGTPLRLESGRLVEDSEEAHTLRELRHAAWRADAQAPGIYIVLDDAHARMLYVRDELPDEVVAQRRRYRDARIADAAK